MRPRHRDGRVASPQRRLHRDRSDPHPADAGSQRSHPQPHPRRHPQPRHDRVWLFDLDNTLHDASHAVFDRLNPAMTDYIVRHLGVDAEQAGRLRSHYWRRYGVTMLGLVRHHGVDADHFLETTHHLPDLERQLRMHAPDRAALRRLPGRRYVLTNAPRRYALRVMAALGLLGLFDGVIAIDDMRMFGGLHRPKPDARMFRHLVACLKVRATDCVLVEDTLDHQRTARSLGMGTVWMTGYARRAERQAARDAPRPGRWPKPAYVCARIDRIQQLSACRIRRG